VSAGTLLVREAGGYVTGPDGRDQIGADIVAGNPHLHPKLLEAVADGLAAAEAAA
jgi:myo-inositol-1(or 4)-monophosphatase